MTYQIFKNKLFLYALWCASGLIIDHRALPDYLTSYSSSSGVIVATLIIVHMIAVFIYMRFYAARDELMWARAKAGPSPKAAPPSAREKVSDRRLGDPKSAGATKGVAVREKKKGILYSLMIGVFFGAASGFGLSQWVIQLPNYLLRSSKDRCVSATVTKRRVRRGGRIEMQLSVEGQDYQLNSGWAQPERDIFETQLGDTVDLILQRGYSSHHFIVDYGPRLCQR